MASQQGEARASLCPKHHVALQPEPEWKGRLLVCPVRGCDVSQTVPLPHQAARQPAKRQMKLPGLDPGRQYKAVRASEAALVKQWVQWAGLHGYEVLQINQNVRYLQCPCCRGKIKQILCPFCQETSPYSLFSQNTTGAPDLFFTHPHWQQGQAAHPGLWAGIEAKRDANAPVREAQARLAALGYIDVVWTLERLQEALRSR